MNKKYTHKLTKGGKYSYYLIVPREIVEKYGWRKKQKITLTDKGRGRLEVRDWRKR